MKHALVVCLLCLPAQSQQPPTPNELLGEPFYVKTIWLIAGKGDWDFVKIDPACRQLFIARGNQVRAADIDTGLTDGH